MTKKIYPEKIYVQVTKDERDRIEANFDNQDPHSGTFLQTSLTKNDQYLCYFDTTKETSFEKFSKKFRDNFARFAETPAYQAEYVKDPKNNDIINLYGFLTDKKSLSIVTSAGPDMTDFLRKVLREGETLIVEQGAYTASGQRLDKVTIRFNKKHLADEERAQLGKFYRGLKYHTDDATGTKKEWTDDQVLKAYGPDFMNLFLFARANIGEAALAPTPAIEPPPPPESGPFNVVNTTVAFKTGETKVAFEFTGTADILEVRDDWGPNKIRRYSIEGNILIIEPGVPTTHAGDYAFKIKLSDGRMVKVVAKAEAAPPAPAPAVVAPPPVQPPESPSQAELPQDARNLLDQIGATIQGQGSLAEAEIAAPPALTPPVADQKAEVEAMVGRFLSSLNKPVYSAVKGTILSSSDIRSRTEKYLGADEAGKNSAALGLKRTIQNLPNTPLEAKKLVAKAYEEFANEEGLDTLSAHMANLVQELDAEKNEEARKAAEAARREAETRATAEAEAALRRPATSDAERRQRANEYGTRFLNDVRPSFKDEVTGDNRVSYALPADGRTLEFEVHLKYDMTWRVAILQPTRFTGKTKAQMEALIGEDLAKYKNLFPDGFPYLYSDRSKDIIPLVFGPYQFPPLVTGIDEEGRVSDASTAPPPPAPVVITGPREPVVIRRPSIDLGKTPSGLPIVKANGAVKTVRRKDGVEVVAFTDDETFTRHIDAEKLKGLEKVQQMTAEKFEQIMTKARVSTPVTIAVSFAYLVKATDYVGGGVPGQGQDLRIQIATTEGTLPADAKGELSSLLSLLMEQIPLAPWPIKDINTAGTTAMVISPKQYQMPKASFSIRYSVE
ncbi:MAG: hypothetical protein HYU99_07545 [Deltaproteobacteria bacterium]|nr:hypothetical protein [Deltaproteobacteria bacterium]